MAYEIIATNKITGMSVNLGGDFETMQEALWQVENNIEFTEDENPNEWEFEIYDNEEDFGEPIDLDDFDPYDEEPYDLEMGFDPYEGDYTWDC